MNDIHQLHRAGLSISDISTLTGRNRRTIRKYLQHPQTPQYGPRLPRPTKLDAYKPFLKERLAAGVWNATVLLRELRERGYEGQYSILTDFLRPLRNEARSVAVRRFETAAGQQAQVDWGELGDITHEDGTRQTLYAFVLTLGHSRAMFAEVATDQKLATFLRMHEAAFAHLGGVPHEILYDWVKTAALGVDERGEIQWQKTFADFARYWNFTPRLCRAYRPQTKGKVENGIGYVRKSFLCGRDAQSSQDLSRQLHTWLGEVANKRVHGTTYRVVAQAWEAEKPHLQPATNRAPYPFVVEVVRRVSRDAFVSYKANRYSVPWQQAGKEVVVRESGDKIEIVREQ